MELGGKNWLIGWNSNPLIFKINAYMKAKFSILCTTIFILTSCHSTNKMHTEPSKVLIRLNDSIVIVKGNSQLQGLRERNKERRIALKKLK